ELRQRLTFGREALDVDAIGDDVVVAGKVGLDQPQRGKRYGDLAVEPAKRTAQKAPRIGVETGAAISGSMEGADIDGVGEAKELNRQERDQGLVDVNDVEGLLL